jgi:two-component system, OmpR family, sensor histidine kinase MprB
MNFRRRIALVAAAAVAIAVVLVSLLTYLLTSHQLHSQVDSQLRVRGREAGALLAFLRTPSQRGSAVTGRAPFGLALGTPRPARGATSGTAGGSSTRPVASGDNLFGNLPPGPGQVRGYQQVVGSSGTILIRSARGVSIPVDARTRRLATNGGQSFFRDAHVGGVHLRVLAEPLGSGRVLQLAQPLTEVDNLLRRLRLILALLDIGGIALAALLGLLVAGAAVLPLKRLTQATEHVALTQDLSQRIEPVGEDEIGRLARSFNSMLDALGRSMSALDASVHAQRQLVADASHELRTPVTSLRTNIEILQQAEHMDGDERRRLLDDVVEQIEELTLLMNDLIDLARGDEPHANAEEMRLDLIVGEVVERARKNAPATPLDVELEPTIVTGVPPRLERAVSNLIDNAVKYSPPGEPVEIRLHGEQLVVRDHGPGISAEDLPHVFDRFYRGAEARRRPGSGLGLAIVRQVVGQQGGSVTAEHAPGGGTLMRLRLPGAEAVEAHPSDPQAAGAHYSSV